MPRRPLAVSLVAFAGHPTEAALDGVAASGASHAEPAFIDGTMVFDEDDLREAAGVALRRQIEAAGLGCVAVSAHLDCGAEGAAERLVRRLRFAAALGARFVITNSAKADRLAALVATLEVAAPVAVACGVTIALENPGFGASDLLASGSDAAKLLAALAAFGVGFNYDPGNVLTNSEGVGPEAEFAAVLPGCAHLHIKDMSLQDGRWVYKTIGDGALDWRAMLALVPPDLPLCVELPLGLIRPAGAPPRRGPTIGLDVAVAAVARSVAFVAEA